ncbi:MAG: HAMP domain-containing protein [Phycisphaeraceae bacterium]|nr:HAMP domain-containing protein [Phycisphaeraceae bacterium]
MKLKHNISLSFAVIVCLVGLVGYISIWTCQQMLQKSIGENSLVFAAELLRDINTDTRFRIEYFEEFAEDVSLRQTLLESNRTFAGMDDVEAYVTDQDHLWTTTPQSEMTAFMQGLIDAELSHTLRAKLAFWEKTSGFPIIGEVFVTNKYGANVCQTNRTSDYYQADESWWHKAKDAGVYLRDVAYDESAHVYSTDICLRIDGPDGDFLGVMKAALNIENALNLIKKAGADSPYQSTNIALFTQAGNAIYDLKESGHNDHPSELPSRQDHANDSAHFAIEKRGQIKKLVTFVSSKEHATSHGVDFDLIVEYDANEVFAPVSVLRTRIIILSIIIAVAAMFNGLLVYMSIRRPIKRLSIAFAEVGQGRLNTQVKVSSGDEIGQLAKSFNRMTRDLTTKMTTIEELNSANQQLQASEQCLLAAETDINQLNQELKDANQGLEEAVQERTKELEGFSYSVSHDLRAPLRAVDGFSRVLEKDYGDTLDKEGKRLLEIVRTNVQRMGTLIDDLLSFSRLGRKAMHPGYVHMNELARDVYAELKSAVPERQINMDMHDVAPAWGDRNLIQQVFVNLISNAIKFTGGRDIGEIEIWSETKDDMNVYCVKDNGAGFEMEYADKLFGVFQRLHSDEEFEGTGIGLALVHRIIKRHEGSIWAESEPDKGATFYFALPRSGKNTENESCKNEEPVEAACC